ncbi:MAG: bifunctional diguanylate cyclase/phosphodiesterase [Cyanobacteria bacterium REEB67]|nr:bifunctional diguanylate cyclase/phosphodiesterase [Cyanobacteria bacterium REEB67]
MSSVNLRKSVQFLAIAFGLMALTSLATLMGFGQARSDRYLESHLTAINELQGLRESLKDVLLTSQRYLMTGEKLQFATFNESVDSAKQHLFTLKAIDGGQYGNSERFRAMANQLGLTLDQLVMDARLLQEKGQNSSKELLLTTRELRDASLLSRNLLAMEQEEASTVRAYISGDSKARGNALPMIVLLLSACSGIYALFLYTGGTAGGGVGDSYLEEGEREREKEGEREKEKERLRNSGASSGPSKVARSTYSGLAAAALASASASSSSSSVSSDGLASASESALRRELELAKEQLERLANVDYLTEVLNLRGLEQMLLAEDNRAHRSGGHLIAMIVNCDNFKKVNDACGHVTGDIILKEVARRIKGTLRPSDHVARVGSDEFIVLLPETQLAYGMRVAERIRLAIADHPMRGPQDPLSITASIGVANLPAKISSVVEVIALTRNALKKSKTSGKNKVTLAREAPSASGEYEALTPRSIVEQLTDVTSFRTVYQPIIDLSSEEITGYEALTRGPDGAFESPGDFFRLCIENDILTTVDLQCLKLSLADIPTMAGPMRFHVNLFPSTLLETPIANLIKLFPEDRSRTTFCIEISEQQFISEPAFLRDQVNALRQAGILVAIDDVGFGRSSLETLILLEPDLVKVDRKYVSGLSTEPAKARLLRRLTNVAKSLGAEIVAEGIEDRKDLPLLKDMGVHYGQGFLWGELLQILPNSEVSS